MKLEDAPNKMVHAEDLADALARLRHHNGGNDANSPVSSPVESKGGAAFTTDAQPYGSRQRSRSSTLIFHPEDHGGSPDLPSIAVDDMTDEPDDVGPAVGAPQRPIMAHTTRPPVELMHDA